MTGPAPGVGNALWLLRLRWVAIAGQLITIAVVTLVWRVTLPLQPLLGLVALTGFTNLVLQGWLSHGTRTTATVDGERGTHLPPLLMTLDLLLLTAMLYFSGGPANPFNFFYFVNLALAAILLPSAWVWSLTAGAIGCYLSFFLVGYHPIAELEVGWNPSASLFADVHKQGMVVAFAGCAIVNSYFISRVARELERRESELRVAEKRRAQSERLEALATLAAGAGHELASPLSTIAVITNDLHKHLDGAPVPASVLEDVALIRSELTHCRSILDRMSGNAGQAVGEQVGQWTLRQIVEEVVGGLRRSERVHITGLDNVAHQKLRVPLQGLAQALRGLVQNGLDAAPQQPVVIRVQIEQDELLFQVRDEGSGMAPATLARAGDPFFTTKEPGQGMGLGLFLTRNVVERLGGQLRLTSQVGQGTTAEVRLPLG